ncbi:hypothetical protein FH972_003821 [Carpinus fangiana]|uniref:Core Histone H2A/H2B/H3 domain-containing protein n=1 Tax=Carpinus fangiana TaxID=176857 RepID=A0A5N6QMR0_9ROSI|nr:hypothetical protein FH972_003821 [Carpinus fangiana]
MEYLNFSLKKKKKFKTFERQKHFTARSTFSKPLLGVCPPFLSDTVLYRQPPLTAGDATEVDSLCSLPHAHPSLYSKRNNHHFWDSKSCVAAHHHRTAEPSQAADERQHPKPPHASFCSGMPSSASPGPNAPPGGRSSRTERGSPRTPGTQSQKKKRRYRPGVVALREIRHFQKTWNLLIPAAPFIRVVKQITFQFSHDVSRWTAEALVALQEAAEDFLVSLFEDGMLCAIHAKRVTLRLEKTSIPNWSGEMLFSHRNSKPNIRRYSERSEATCPLKKDFELARRLGGKGRPW